MRLIHLVLPNNHQLQEIFVSKVQLPQVLKITVLSFRITARAWIDEEFRSQFLKNPRAFLLESSDVYPRGCSYLILEDTPSLRHYTIPYLYSDEMVQLGDQLLSTIKMEMGSERENYRDFDFWLPPLVIYQALIDPEYLAELNRRPTALLREEGYDVPCDIRVIQNAPTTYHIPLRYNHRKITRFDEALLVASGDELPQ